jgi:hypothetical protein
VCSGQNRRPVICRLDDAAGAGAAVTVTTHDHEGLGHFRLAVGELPKVSANADLPSSVLGQQEKDPQN